MTNQASEDDLRYYICRQYTKSYTDMSADMRAAVDKMVDITHPFIRTEKLKLLDEVRERVVGGNDYQPGNPAPDLVEHNRLVRDGLRFEQRIALNKLEAEL